MFSEILQNSIENCLGLLFVGKFLKAVNIFSASRTTLGEGNGNPLQCSCLENPRDGGVWWVAISEVTQSWTQLKRLSSSSRTMLTIRLEALPLCFSRNVSILFAFKLKGVKGYHSLSFKICNMKINTLFSFLVLFIHASVYSLPVSPEFQFTCAFRIKFCLC